MSWLFASKSAFTRVFAKIDLTDACQMQYLDGLKADLIAISSQGRLHDLQLDAAGSKVPATTKQKPPAPSIIFKHQA